MSGAIHPPIYRVAIPAPLRRCYDYLAPLQHAAAETTSLQPGMRVWVPFGRQRVMGIVLEVCTQTTISVHKLRHIESVVDTKALLLKQDLKLLLWAKQYYQHPIGEVLQAGIPLLLRQGKAAEYPQQNYWTITALGQQVLRDEAQTLRRAPRQLQLLQLIAQLVGQTTFALREQDLPAQAAGWRAVMQRMVDKHWLSLEQRSTTLHGTDNRNTIQPLSETAPEPNAEQQQALDAILPRLASTTNPYSQFAAFLLYGVTGSGKTEVYLRAAQQVLLSGKQILVLVPEIGLTPQLLQRFRSRLAAQIVSSHSALNDSQRLTAWLALRDGTANILIGTRSAVFTPMRRPGLIIIDEEHDVSFKQQDGFRYSAKDLAIVRAKNLDIPIILGSATPSLESLFNVSQHRFTMLTLLQRAGQARSPSIHIQDVRHLPMQQSLCVPLLDRMTTHLQHGKQVMLFLNRRGYAPTIMCHDCGWAASCSRCDKHMTHHTASNRLRCHHCGAQQHVPRLCPSCEQQNLISIGHGTQRIEELLHKYFPHYSVIRIDRDNTRAKGALQTIFDDIHNGKHHILLGTQILAKGHHFPNVTLVGIVDVDHGLFSADFRASERMAQLLLQVAGRAGRANEQSSIQGEVIIQTHHPHHPLLLSLISNDYRTFAQQLLQERSETQFPPYTHLAVLRAEATDKHQPLNFLQQARQFASSYATKVELLGPFPAPMERRAGRYRAQLILQSYSRQYLHQCLTPLSLQLESSKQNRQVRWSLDVDPMEMY